MELTITQEQLELILNKAKYIFGSSNEVVRFIELEINPVTLSPRKEIAEEKKSGMGF